MKKLEDSGIKFALMNKSVSAINASRLGGKLICLAFPFGCVLDLNHILNSKYLSLAPITISSIYVKIEYLMT